MSPNTIKDALHKAERSRYKKKDYEAFAKILREKIDHHRKVAQAYEEDGAQGSAWGNRLVVSALSATAEDIAQTFAADSPKFDRSRFLTACGIDNDKNKKA